MGECLYPDYPALTDNEPICTPDGEGRVRQVNIEEDVEGRTGKIIPAGYKVRIKINGRWRTQWYSFEVLKACLLPAS